MCKGSFLAGPATAMICSVSHTAAACPVKDTSTPAYAWAKVDISPTGEYFFEYHLAGHVGENLHGHPLPDFQRPPDFLRDDHPTQVVNPPYNSCGFHTIPPKMQPAKSRPGLCSCG